MRSSILKLAVVAAIGLSGVVRADTITQTVSFSFSDSTTTPGATIETLLFNQFDSVLGSLTGVKIQLGNPLTALAFEVEATGMGGFRFQDALATAKVDIPTMPSSGQSTLPLAGSCIRPDGSECHVKFFFTPPVQFGYGPVGYPSSALDSFIGPGTFDLDLSLLASVNRLCDNGCTVIGTANWSGAVVMRYTYDPAPPASVPEPASFLMIGTGLASICARLRVHRF